jgi:pyruvate-formate lyase-activating enzyme
MLKEGKVGFCGVRGNIDGRNVDLLAGVVVNPYWFGNLDLRDPNRPFMVPIFNVAWPGCNLRCGFCAIRMISRPDFNQPHWIEMSPLQLVRLAGKVGTGRILLTSEPSIHPESVIEICKSAHKYQLQVYLYTNGYSNPEIARILAEHVDGVICGLKGSLNKAQYAKLGVETQGIKETIQVYGKYAREFMISNMVGPSVPTTDQDDRELGRWILEDVGNIPMEVGMESAPFPNDVTRLAGPVRFLPNLTVAERSAHRVERNLRSQGLTRIALRKYDRSIRNTPETNFWLRRQWFSA